MVNDLTSQKKIDGYYVMMEKREEKRRTLWKKVVIRNFERKRRL